MIKLLFVILSLISFAACTPSENITAIKENAYQSGFEQGRLKGISEAEQAPKATVNPLGSWQRKPAAPSWVTYYNTWETPPQSAEYLRGYYDAQEAHRQQDEINGENRWH
jgi:hypothetical protein